MILLTKSYAITQNGLEWITPQQYDSLKSPDIGDFWDDDEDDDS